MDRWAASIAHVVARIYLAAYQHSHVLWGAFHISLNLTGSAQ